MSAKWETLDPNNHCRTSSRPHRFVSSLGTERLVRKSRNSAWLPVRVRDVFRKHFARRVRNCRGFLPSLSSEKAARFSCLCVVWRVDCAALFIGVDCESTYFAMVLVFPSQGGLGMTLSWEHQVPFIGAYVSLIGSAIAIAAIILLKRAQLQGHWDVTDLIPPFLSEKIVAKMLSAI